MQDQSPRGPESEEGVHFTANTQRPERLRRRAAERSEQIKVEVSKHCEEVAAGNSCETILRRTELEAQNEELIEDLAMLTSVFSTVPVGVCVTDAEGRYVRVNPAYCEIYGYVEDELIGHSFTKVVLPEQRAGVLALHQAFLEGKKEVPAEWTIVRKDGEKRIIATNVARVVREDGRAYKVTVVSDITELNRIRREREIYFHSLRDSIHPVVITDKAGRITHVNHAFERLYGYREAETLGQTPRILNPGREVYRDLGFDAKAYADLFGRMWQDILDPQVGYWEGDLHNRKKDGALITVHLFICAVRDEAGDTAAFFAMPMDVTHQRQEEFNIRLECYRAINQLAATRDKETGGHLFRISQYTKMLAELMEMPKRFVMDIEIFSPLHDIGKVGIPDSILLAPRNLTPDERRIMDTHASLGYEILQGRPTLEMAAEIAGGHHEKWDGSGYPQGIAGEIIPLAARMMALADVYDALRSRRHYKPPWPHDETVAVISDGRGKHFDPALVDLFLARQGAFATVAERFKDNENEG